MRCALESSDTGITRLRKIEDMIAECKFSIHDLSRVEADPKNDIFPRFNIPFELGLCFGAKAFGEARQKQKAFLVMDTEPYRYQKMISDLSGQDPASHGDSPEQVIGAIRRFFADKVPKSILLPGEAAIIKRYQEFKAKLPAMAAAAKLTMAELNSLKYWSAMLFLMKQWQFDTSKKRKP